MSALKYQLMSNSNLAEKRKYDLLTFDHESIVSLRLLYLTVLMYNLKTFVNLLLVHTRMDSKS